MIKWEESDIMFENIQAEILPIVQSLKLVRLDKSELGNTSVLLIVPDEKISIETISNKLQKLDKNMRFTFFEAKTNW